MKPVKSAFGPEPPSTTRPSTMPHQKLLLCCEELHSLKLRPVVIVNCKEHTVNSHKGRYILRMAPFFVHRAVQSQVLTVQSCSLTMAISNQTEDGARLIHSVQPKPRYILSSETTFDTHEVNVPILKPIPMDVIILRESPRDSDC